MSVRLEFGCLPTAIGSMPHTDPEEACSSVLKYLPDIPAWPQLPNRSAEESMYIQFSEGFPGTVINGDKIHIEPGDDFVAELEQIYTDCEESDASSYSVSAGYAAGLHTLLAKANKTRMVKGQIIGPITWGLTITDQDGQAILYDETLAEVMAKFLRLKASWQENALRRLSPNLIIFVDEPYLLSLGSVFVPVPEERVPALLEEVLQGIKGVKGLHCCGNTNWSVLLNTSIDVLSFDAYNYTDSLSTYIDEVESFLARGSAIAWGIIPNDEDALAKESVSSLYERLGEAMAPFTRNGVSFKQIVSQGLLTPSCGLATLSTEAADRALELLAKLSNNIRRKYAVC
ncbi:MAG: methionine synthase [Chloroflexota bacterium]|nr:methionine synthase [Chloroflexota bacterium]